jgi:hypothetical protein
MQFLQITILGFGPTTEQFNNDCYCEQSPSQYSRRPGWPSPEDRANARRLLHAVPFSAHPSRNPSLSSSAGASTAEASGGASGGSILEAVGSALLDGLAAPVAAVVMVFDAQSTGDPKEAAFQQKNAQNAADKAAEIPSKGNSKPSLSEHKTAVKKVH